MKNHQNFTYVFITFLLFIFLLFTFSLQLFPNSPTLFFLKNFYNKICHQIESRCFFVNEKPMLICSRCSGIFGGAFILFLILSLSKKFRSFLYKIDTYKIFYFLVPLLIEWLINFIFKIESTNFVRFSTGIIFSIVPVYFLNLLFINSKVKK
jgi:uncharacterized membrane protein